MCHLKMLSLAVTLTVWCGAFANDVGKGWTMINAQGNPIGRRAAGFIGPVGGKMFLLGGRKKKQIEVFDPVTSTWSRQGKWTNDVHHFQPVIWDDKIFIICALEGKYPVEDPVPHVLMYDPANNGNTGKFPLVEYALIPEDRRRGSAAVAVYQDKFYIVGGITVGHSSGTNKLFDEFDPATGTWKVLKKKPRRVRDHAGAAVFDDKLWVAGGRVTTVDDGNVFNGLVPELEYYDFKKKKWFPKKKKFNTAPMLVPPRAAPAVAFYQGLLWVMGGTTTDMVNSTSIYDPAAETWVEGPTLSDTRGAFTAIIHDNEIWIASGARTVQEDTNTIEKTYTLP